MNRFTSSCETREFYRGKSFRYNLEDWSSTTPYVNDDYIQDFVSYEGKMYACLLTNTGVPVTNTTYWKFVMEGQPGVKGDVGTIFTPHVDANGILTWSNTAGLTNPDPVSIKGTTGSTGKQGIQGLTGKQGNTGPQGLQGIQGIGLEYIWDGTKLGIKKTTDSEFEFVDIKGQTGSTGKTGLQGLTGLQGERGLQGEKGERGPSIMLQVSDEDVNGDRYLQYRYSESETWSNLYDIAVLKGDPGDPIILEKNILSGSIEWRYVSEPTSANRILVLNDEIKGDSGDTITRTYVGDDGYLYIQLSSEKLPRRAGYVRGDKGVDGRQIVLRVDNDPNLPDGESGTGTHLQWKYEGDEFKLWHNLVQINDLMNIALSGLKLEYELVEYEYEGELTKFDRIQLANYKVKYDEDGNLILTDFIGNISHIDIPLKTTLGDIVYDEITNELVFIFNTASGTEEKRVDCSNFYEAGNGIQIDGKTFNVIIDPTSESINSNPILESTPTGLKVTGLLPRLIDSFELTIDPITNDLVYVITTIDGTKYNAEFPEVLSAINNVSFNDTTNILSFYFNDDPTGVKTLEIDLNPLINHLVTNITYNGTGLLEATRHDGSKFYVDLNTLLSGVEYTLSLNGDDLQLTIVNPDGTGDMTSVDLSPILNNLIKTIWVDPNTNIMYVTRYDNSIVQIELPSVLEAGNSIEIVDDVINVTINPDSETINGNPILESTPSGLKITGLVAHNIESFELVNNPDGTSEYVITTSNGSEYKALHPDQTFSEEVVDNVLFNETTGVLTFEFTNTLDVINIDLSVLINSFIKDVQLDSTTNELIVTRGDDSTYRITLASTLVAGNGIDITDDVVSIKIDPDGERVNGNLTLKSTADGISTVGLTSGLIKEFKLNDNTNKASLGSGTVNNSTFAIQNGGMLNSSVFEFAFNNINSSTSQSIELSLGNDWYLILDGINKLVNFSQKTGSGIIEVINGSNLLKNTVSLSELGLESTTVNFSENIITDLWINDILLNSTYTNGINYEIVTESNDSFIAQVLETIETITLVDSKLEILTTHGNKSEIEISTSAGIKDFKLNSTPTDGMFSLVDANVGSDLTGKLINFNPNSEIPTDVTNVSLAFESGEIIAFVNNKLSYVKSDGSTIDIFTRNITTGELTWLVTELLLEGNTFIVNYNDLINFSSSGWGFKNTSYVGYTYNKYEYEIVDDKDISYLAGFPTTGLLFDVSYNEESHILKLFFKSGDTGELKSIDVNLEELNDVYDVVPSGGLGITDAGNFYIENGGVTFERLDSELQQLILRYATEVTYAELMVLKDNKELQIGKWYIINDYRASSIVFNESTGIEDVVSSDPKILLVQALFTNDFHKLAYLNIGYYVQVNWNHTNFIGGFKTTGKITHLVDPEGNECNFDIYNTYSYYGGKILDDEFTSFKNNRIYYSLANSRYRLKLPKYCNNNNIWNSNINVSSDTTFLNNVISDSTVLLVNVSALINNTIKSSSFDFKDLYSVNTNDISNCTIKLRGALPVDTLRLVNGNIIKYSDFVITAFEIMEGTIITDFDNSDVVIKRFLSTTIRSSRLEYFDDQTLTYQYILL